jgi:hypothetical protein
MICYCAPSSVAVVNRNQHMPAWLFLGICMLAWMKARCTYSLTYLMFLSFPVPYSISRSAPPAPGTTTTASTSPVRPEPLTQPKLHSRGVAMTQGP